jgi:hypothetical protein
LFHYFNGETKEADRGTKQIKEKKKGLKNKDRKKIISCGISTSLFQ